MAIDKINLFAQPINGPKLGVQPLGSPKREPLGIKAVGEESFQTAKLGFSQKTNPFGFEGLSFQGAKSNHQVGLSPMATGALGDEAIHTKGGRLGRELNLFA